MREDAERVLRLLRLHESYRQHPYLCSAGILTIGYGRNLIDTGISEPEARYLLVNDISGAWSQIQAALPAFKMLDPVRRAVLLDMAVNMGIRGLLRFQKMLVAVTENNFELAAAEMVNSKWHGQVKTRAPRLEAMMASGEWPTEIMGG